MGKRIHNFRLSLLIAWLPTMLVSCGDPALTPVDQDMQFAKRLSAYGLFEGVPSNMVPKAEVQLLELSATLFTDYAHKQRLLKLPPGTFLIAQGAGLPVFPEGTMLAKTFFYFKDERNPAAGKQIIETRLLVLKKKHWNLATYRWNTAQTEAFLLTEGTDATVRWKDLNGSKQTVNYHIPSENECVQCHQSAGKNVPIGPKLQNLQRSVEKNGSNVSQLEYLKKLSLLQGNISAKTPSIPAYTDVQHTDRERARSYFEINCAHCHQPDGFAAEQGLDLRYHTPLSASGIPLEKWSIISRMHETGSGKMPAIGTTCTDLEGLKIVEKYLEEL